MLTSDEHTDGLRTYLTSLTEAVDAAVADRQLDGSGGARRRWPLVVGAAAAVLAVAALVAGGFALTGDSDSPYRGFVAGEDVRASCVEEFSLAGLRSRAFAFDGTVVEVMSEMDPQLPDDGSGRRPQPRARFEVSEWFAGGSDATVLVWLQREVSVGDRLLVSGEPRWGGAPLDDAIQWECGWTVAYTANDASAWREAVAP